LESKLKEAKGFGEKITGIEKSLNAKSSLKILNSFHPEMALFRNLCVDPRNHLCGVPVVRLRVIP
jgi:hypothetical protein